MATVILFFFPDTWGVPLEEVAAIFGVGGVYRLNDYNESIRPTWKTLLTRWASQDRDELYHFDDEERQRATVTQGEKDIGHNRSDEIEQAL